MSWLGVESMDDDRARRKAKPTDRQDWMLRVRFDGREFDARLIRLTEPEAHEYARRVSADYSLKPARIF